MPAQKRNPVDKLVGSRVRMRRIMLDMSQTQLGEQLGISFQQVQKYEKGTNRISAGRLQDIARLMTVPVAFFFEGTASLAGDNPREYTVVDEFLSTSEGVALATAWQRIPDRKLRLAILSLTEQLAELYPAAA